MGKIDNIDFDNLPLPGENFERIAHTRPTDSEATHIKTARPRTRLNGPGLSDVTTAVDSEDLETDEKKYDLKLNVDALERITGDGSPSSENLRKEVDRFVRICQNQKIDEFAFGVYRGAIDSIGAMGEVTDEKGENVTERASLKLSVFQKIFSGSSYLYKPGTKEPFGLHLGSEDGASFYPGMDENLAKQIILSEVTLSGRPLIRVEDSERLKNLSVRMEKFDGPTVM